MKKKSIPNTVDKISAIILAGGKSSRMGEDKGLKLFNKNPLIEHVINAVKPVTDDILIVTNNSAYQRLGYPVHKDIIENAGPLAGVYTGLQFIKAKKSIVLSCDVPNISNELIQFLISQSNGFDVTIPQKNDRIHPLIGVYSRKCSELFKNELQNNQRKMMIALRKVKLNIVNADQFDVMEFDNINTKTDYDLLKNDQ